MRLEQSFGIIRPDGMKSKNKILKMIRDSGLKIVKKKEVYLSIKSIKALYPRATKEVLDIRKKQYGYGDGISLLFIVEGTNAIEKLLNIIGRETDPAKCESNTVRFIFGNKKSPVLLKNGKIIYFNAAHRAKNAQEAMEQIKFFNNI